MSYATNFAGYVAFKAQSALGTPATGSGGHILRQTGGAPGKLSKAAIESKEIRPDAQHTRGRHGMQATTGGPYSTELSIGSFDEIIEALMRGTWATDTGILINPPAGSLVNRYFSIEEVESDLGASRVFSDCMWKSAKIALATNQMIMFEPAWVGTGAMTVQTGSPVLTSPTLGSSTPMAALDAVLSLNGSPVADIVSLDITIDNGAVAPSVVGSRVSPTVLPGLNQVSLNMVVLQKDMTKISAHLNETSFALSLVCNAGADSIEIDVPFFTLGSADISPMSTAGGARTVTIGVPAALVGRDPTTGTMIKFTRSNIAG